VGTGAVPDVIGVSAVVTVGEIANVTLRPGESGNVTVPLIVAPGYHIQSNPASNEFLVPLELQLEDSDDIRFGAPDYPTAAPYRLEGTDEDLMTYHGNLSVTIRVTLSPSVSIGEKPVTGTLRYQACDSKRCLFPSSIPVSFKVIVR
jgi:hypothetical protein